MYRKDALKDPKYCDIIAVMHHEIFELERSDILTYILDNYTEVINLSWFYRICSTFNNRAVLTYKAQRKFCTGLVDLLNGYFHAHLKYCLWLVDKPAALEQNTTRYKASSFVLTDLGPEGVLFAYEAIPRF